MIPASRSIRTMAAVLAGFVIFGSVADAVAWGSKGHRIVGHVARELLSPDARAEIVALMASDDLATFALYLDQNKDRLDQQIPGSREWHYDDVPICEPIASLRQLLLDDGRGRVSVVLRERDARLLHVGTAREAGNLSISDRFSELVRLVDPGLDRRVEIGRAHV